MKHISLLWTSQTCAVYIPGANVYTHALEGKNERTQVRRQNVMDMVAILGPGCRLAFLRLGIAATQRRRNKAYSENAVDDAPCSQQTNFSNIRLQCSHPQSNNSPCPLLSTVHTSLPLHTCSMGHCTLKPRVRKSNTLIDASIGHAKQDAAWQHYA